MTTSPYSLSRGTVVAQHTCTLSGIRRKQLTGSPAAWFRSGPGIECLDDLQSKSLVNFYKWGWKRCKEIPGFTSLSVHPTSQSRSIRWRMSPEKRWCPKIRRHIFLERIQKYQRDFVRARGSFNCPSIHSTRERRTARSVGARGLRR